MVQVQKPDSSRAFVFDVQVGFTKGNSLVDPLSGMLINLVWVDQILAELALVWSQGSWKCLGDLLKASRKFLESKAQNEGVLLAELTLREKRGFWVASKAGAFFMGREVLRELEGQLYRLRMESAFKESSDEFLDESSDESGLEEQDLLLEKAEDLQSGTIFVKNPSLQSLDIENLGTGERWILHP